MGVCGPARMARSRTDVTRLRWRTMVGCPGECPWCDTRVPGRLSCPLLPPHTRSPCDFEIRKDPT
jgi:hypothetical protein